MAAMLQDIVAQLTARCAKRYKLLLNNDGTDAPEAFEEEPDLPFLAERKKLLQAAKKLVAEGLSPGSSGNVSCRVEGSFLFAAARDTTTLEEVELCSFEEEREGWCMHADVYRAFPEAAAVVHAQPACATALAGRREGIPAFHYMVAVGGGKMIPCTEYCGVGRKEVSAAMVAALKRSRSVLLANQGMVCFGPNVDKAMWLANETECLAKQYVAALSARTEPTMLSQEEMDVILAKFKTYGKQPDQLKDLSEFEKQHKIVLPTRRPMQGGPLVHIEERKEVIKTCLAMNAMGINQGTSGNVSVRIPGGFLITASGVAYETMTPEMVVMMDMNGDYFGEYAPSSEWRMHYDVYKRIPEALAVVHAHPTYCTALSSLRRDIPAFHYMVAAAGGDHIRCAEYETFGSQELSDSMVSALGPRKSCLLANHGMICHGATLPEALWLAGETECLARSYLAALSTGGEPRLLPEEDLERVLEKVRGGERLAGRERRRFFSGPCFPGVVAE